MPKRPQRKVPDDGVQYFSVQVGEDAYFVRSDSLGVADGVGGWAQVKGANPALYSRKLMHYASAELEKLDDIMESEYTIEDYNNADPRSILQKSYEKTNLDAVAENLLGSSTAIIAILRDDELRIANLGDCGVMVIRQDEAIFRTEEQQHSFNFPYQLGTGSRDTPNDAQIYKLKVEEGDIVILGSDGMFDNVFDEDIVDIVRSAVQSRKPTAIDPQRITDGLLKRAREIAEDGRLVSSPFQSRAIQEGLYYQGGKMDDVTVLVGVVRLSEDSPDRR
ncbi:phosphatase 2C-like domain-containing protein [Gaertneriomyces semiglobifer]|nr:phosphatase 2C-like domain-containing protein [Gaertneriomyces semiglobifer]